MMPALSEKLSPNTNPSGATKNAASHKNPGSDSAANTPAFARQCSSRNALSLPEKTSRQRFPSAAPGVLYRILLQTNLPSNCLAKRIPFRKTIYCAAISKPKAIVNLQGARGRKTIALCKCRRELRGGRGWGWRFDSQSASRHCFSRARPRLDHQVYCPSSSLRRRKTSVQPASENSRESHSRSCGRKPEFLRLPPPVANVLFGVGDIKVAANQKLAAGFFRLLAAGNKPRHQLRHRRLLDGLSRIARRARRQIQRHRRKFFKVHAQKTAPPRPRPILFLAAQSGRQRAAAVFFASSPTPLYPRRSGRLNSPCNPAGCRMPSDKSSAEARTSCMQTMSAPALCSHSPAPFRQAERMPLRLKVKTRIQTSSLRREAKVAEEGFEPPTCGL